MSRWGSVLRIVAVGIYSYFSGNWAQLAAQVESERQRRKRDKDNARARAAYNESLKDRLQMLDLTPDMPRTLALGRVRYVEGVRRRWTTGTNSEKLTMIVSFAGHEVDEFESWYIDDTPVTLDVDGWVQESPWKTTVAEPFSDYGTADSGGNATITLSHTPIASSWSAAWSKGNGDNYEAGNASVSVSGTTATVTGAGASSTVTVNYTRSLGSTYVRIRTYAGTTSQNVGDAIDSEYTGQITSTDKFAGIALAVVDLIYSPDVFPQGPPNITAVFRGAKCYDPRLDNSVVGTSAWNPSNKASSITLSGGNLVASSTGLGAVTGTGGSSAESGDWYCEITLGGSDTNILVGIAKAGFSVSTYCGGDTNSYGIYALNGHKYHNGASQGITAITGLAAGDVVGLRLTGGVFSVAKNSSDPSSFQTIATGLTGLWYPAYSTAATSASGSGTLNVGATAFSFQPTGTDPWDGGQRINDPTTWAWTENPALHALRYAMWSSGFGLTASQISDTTIADVIEAADQCDISTDFDLVMPDTSTDTVTLPRHRAGLTIPADMDKRQAMDMICDCMAGEWAWDGPDLRIRAGMMRDTVAAIDETWLMEPVSAGDSDPEPIITASQSISREQRVNRISGKCVDPDQRYQLLPYPAVSDATLISAKGEKREEMDLPGVNHIAHAQHLASIEIRRRQAGQLLQISADARAELLQLFDVVTLDLDDWGIAAKTYEVVGTDLSMVEAPVGLMLREITDDIFTVDATLDGRDPAPDSNLRAPWDVGTLGTLTVISGTAALQDNSIVARALVTWSAVTGEWIRKGGKIEIQYTRADEPLPSGDWASWVEEGNSTSAMIPGLLTGRPYMFRGRLVQPMPLVRGPWSVITHHTMASAISALSAIGGGNLLVNSDFEVDSNSDNVPDGWTAYSAGTTGTITNAVTTTGVGGGKRMRVTTTGLGTSTSDRAGVYQMIELAQLAGRPFAFSCYMAGSSSGVVDFRLYVDFKDTAGGAGSTVEAISETFSDASEAWTRYVLRGTIPTGAVSCNAFIWMAARNTSSGAAEFSMDKAQFEIGMPTSYKPRADELLAGVVTTTNLASNAATEILTDSDGADSVSTGGSSGTVSELMCNVFYDNTTGADVTIQFEATVFGLYGDGAGIGTVAAYWQYDIDNGTPVTGSVVGFSGTIPTSTTKMQGIGIGQVTVPAGSDIDIEVYGLVEASAGGGTTYWDSAFLRATVIKR